LGPFSVVEAIDLTEETKSGTLQDCAEPNRDFNALTITNVPEVSEEEIKDETLSQEESIINESYSAFTMVVSEEAGLKEAKLENNEQIKSFDYKEISKEDQVALAFKFCASKMTSYVCSSLSTNPFFNLPLSFILFNRNLKYQIQQPQVQFQKNRTQRHQLMKTALH
jgi:hypothetical protein